MKKRVQAPGSRGGKYWIDHRGTIRYDDPPVPRMGEREVELHPVPEGGEALDTWTPGAIDTKLMVLHVKYMRQAAPLREANKTMLALMRKHAPNAVRENRSAYDETEAKLDPDLSVPDYQLKWDGQLWRRAKGTVAEQKPVLRRIAAEMEPYEREYRNRPWSRFYLCTNDNGHVHSSMHCGTCRPTTEFAWQPELSGQTEKAAVEEFGRLMCTVCFPSAPTDYIGARERKTLAEKNAVRGEKQAKALAAVEKGVAYPGRFRRDGLPELWFKTERAAYEDLEMRVRDYERIAREMPPGGYPEGIVLDATNRPVQRPLIDSGGKVRPATDAELERHGYSVPGNAYTYRLDRMQKVAKALADKHGTSIDEEVAIAKDKSKWPKIVRTKVAKGVYLLVKANVKAPGARGGKYRVTPKGDVRYDLAGSDQTPGLVSAPYCALEGCPNPASQGVLCERHRKLRRYGGGEGTLDAEQQRRVFERERKWRAPGALPMIGKR